MQSIKSNTTEYNVSKEKKTIFFMCARAQSISQHADAGQLNVPL